MQTHADREECIRRNFGHAPGEPAKMMCDHNAKWERKVCYVESGRGKRKVEIIRCTKCQHSETWGY